MVVLLVGYAYWRVGVGGGVRDSNKHVYNPAGSYFSPYTFMYITYTLILHHRNYASGINLYGIYLSGIWYTVTDRNRKNVDYFFFLSLQHPPHHHCVPFL